MLVCKKQFAQTEEEGWEVKGEGKGAVGRDGQPREQKTNGGVTDR
jgi:hypothetical protein